MDDVNSIAINYVSDIAHLSLVARSLMLKPVPSGKTYRQYLSGMCSGTVLHSCRRAIANVIKINSHATEASTTLTSNSALPVGTSCSSDDDTKWDSVGNDASIRCILKNCCVV